MDVYVTVSVDGAYGCSTSSGSTCTIPLSEGQHDVVARASDGRVIRQSLPNMVAGDAYKLCLFDENDADAVRECGNWVNGK